MSRTILNAVLGFARQDGAVRLREAIRDYLSRSLRRKGPPAAFGYSGATWDEDNLADAVQDVFADVVLRKILVLREVAAEPASTDRYPETMINHYFEGRRRRTDRLGSLIFKRMLDALAALEKQGTVILAGSRKVSSLTIVHFGSSAGAPATRAALHAALHAWPRFDETAAKVVTRAVRKEHVIDLLSSMLELGIEAARVGDLIDTLKDEIRAVRLDPFMLLGFEAGEPTAITLPHEIGGAEEAAAFIEEMEREIERRDLDDSRRARLEALLHALADGARPDTGEDESFRSLARSLGVKSSTLHDSRRLLQDIARTVLARRGDGRATHR